MEEAKLHFPRPDLFFDRERELDALNRAWKRKRGGLALLYGRRRVGKTYLLQRFLADVEGARGKCYFLADQSTAETQRLAVAQRLLEAFPSGLTPRDLAVSWNALLRYFGAKAKEAKSQRVALVLDEFPYLVDQTPELPSIIQAWWDEDGLHSDAFLILCGSQLSVMASLSNLASPLHGRFTAGSLRLEPMTYADVAEFYKGASGYGPVEKMIMYGALGGSPRYHAQADPTQPWDEQIVDLLLRPGAPFENEAHSLLSSEQVRDPAPYNAVLGAVAAGKTRYSEIQGATGLTETSLHHPLKVLQEIEWVRKERSYGETTDRRALYRVADPFLNFWYRFGAPLASALRVEEPRIVFRERIAPRLDDYIGWCVFEPACSQWLSKHGRAAIGASVESISRFWSRDGQLEIDQIAELENGGKLFGECKWSAHTKLQPEDYFRFRGKIEALPHREWKQNARFALYSMGGFSEELLRIAEADRNLLLVDGSRLYAH